MQTPVAPQEKPDVQVETQRLEEDSPPAFPETETRDSALWGDKDGEGALNPKPYSIVVFIFFSIIPIYYPYISLYSPTMGLSLGVWGSGFHPKPVAKKGLG